MQDLATSPDFPWCLAVLPQFFQQNFLAQRVHGLPETLMFKGHQLVLTGQGLNWRSFPRGAIIR
jgi:hypothetical protein